MARHCNEKARMSLRLPSVINSHPITSPQILPRLFDASGRSTTTTLGNGLIESRVYIPGDNLVEGQPEHGHAPNSQLKNEPQRTCVIHRLVHLKRRSSSDS